MEPPVSRSRLEINFIRLLDETQSMANSTKTKDWTFEKYIGWLQEKIPEMEKSPNAPNEETLKHYRRQVDFLRGIIEAEKCPEVLESAAVSQLIPHGPATTSDNSLAQQIHHKTQAKTTNRLRQDLLGINPEDDEGELRNRGGSSHNISTDDFNGQMLSQEEKRERVVEDMIAMTREWKEQSKIANKIIKKDVDYLENSSKLAETNQAQLKIESNRLAEYNKRACNFWIWIMIIFVCFTFIGMVMFIKIFPRRN